jgi:hypothetical protein
MKKRVMRALVSVALVFGATSVSVPATSAADNTLWGQVASPEDGGWLGVTYAAGQFVAVGSKGTQRVMTSPDGKTWTMRTAAEMNTWNAVTYGNGKFVAVAGDGTNRVMTSPDGITWTAQQAASASRWQAITFGNGIFVATAQNGTTQIMTSPDGATWTARTTPNFSVSRFWTSVTYGNGVFVATGSCSQGTGTECVMTSPDGITWTKRNASIEGSWGAVAFGNGVFVSVSSDGAKNIAMTSPDGITWTTRNIPAGENPYAVIYTGTKFVAAGGNGKRVITSTDGVTWDFPVDSSKIQIGIMINSIAYGNNTVIGVGFGSEYFMSSAAVEEKVYYGVVTRKFGPGPLRVFKWVFKGVGVGSLPEGTKVSVVVSSSSRKICKMDRLNHLVALKSGDCNATLVLKAKSGESQTLPLLFRADATRK